MIRLAKPSISEEAIACLNEVLRSGNLVQGKYVLEFEAKLSAYLNVKNAVAVSSGTAALHLSLIALGVKEGDEVIVPDFTFPASANVVELVGAKPVMVDIGLSDFCIDTSKIEAAITSKTVAIMPVHEFGQAAVMDDILHIAKKYKLKIVEDAACALGTKYKGKNVGTFGEFGCFSFHPRKAITTGEGGVIVTNNEQLADKVRVLRNHGMETLNGKLEFIVSGFNYRLTDFQAVLGSYQLDEFDEQIVYRKELASQYDKLLSEISWIKTPAFFENRDMTYQTYHVLIKEDIDRDSLIHFLFEHDIQSNNGAQALHRQKYYTHKYNLDSSEYKNALYAYNQGLALPIGPHINTVDLIEIKETLQKFL